jgi:pilus assembly protein CpaD
MTSPFRSASKLAGTALALSLGLTLAGCGGIATNATLDSIHQPVVEHVNYTFDVTTGPGGLSYPEQHRLTGWLDTMDLRYGDRISIDDPLANEDTRAAVEAIAGRYGILMSADAPTTPGNLSAGTARIIITRAKASVPGCPDWSSHNDFNPNNATSSNFGCAVNANLAAMVADPEHLIRGANGGSATTVMSANKAISSYREQKPTGEKGLKETSSTKVEN